MPPSRVNVKRKVPSRGFWEIPKMDTHIHPDNKKSLIKAIMQNCTIPLQQGVSEMTKSFYFFIIFGKADI
jgi:hypothetical protein